MTLRRLLSGVRGAVRPGVLVGGGVAASAVAVVVALSTGGGGGVGCTGADVTTATFSARVSASAPGDTLCLAAGDYGTWAGANKAAPGITLKPATGLAQSAVTLTPSFTTGTISNITVQGVTTHDITIEDNASNVTIKDFHEAGVTVIRIDNMLNAGIVLDNGDFDMADCPDASATCRGDATEGRLGITNFSNTLSANAGVQVKNSRIHDGAADGIQNGGQYAYGVTIGPGNEFYRLDLGGGSTSTNPNGIHVDAIQMGSNGLKITGNYFHDDDVGVVNYDASPADVEVSNNAFDHIPSTGPTSPCAAICVGAASNLMIKHNTLASTAFIIINVNHNGTSSTNITLRDNVLDGPVGTQGSPTFAAQDHNLCLAGTCAGTGSLSGAPGPTWVGGSTPTTLAGYVLSPGSRGRAVASDGTDIGYNAP